MPEELSTLLLDSTFRQSIEYAKCYYDDCRHSIQALNQYLAKQNFSSFPPQNDKELYNLLMLDPNNTKASLIQYRVAGIPAATDFSAIQRRQDKVTYWLYTQDPRINHINTSSISVKSTGKPFPQIPCRRPRNMSLLFLRILSIKMLPIFICIRQTSVSIFRQPSILSMLIWQFTMM